MDLKEQRARRQREVTVPVEAVLAALGPGRSAHARLSLRVLEEQRVIKSAFASVDWKTIRDERPDEWRRAYEAAVERERSEMVRRCLLKRAGLSQ